MSCGETSGAPPRSRGEAGAGRALVRLTPLALPVCALFLGGLALAVAQSLGWWLPFEHHGGPWAGYRAAFSPHLMASLGFSLAVALVSASLSVALGALGGYAVWNMPRALRRASVVYKVGLILPHMAVAFVVLVLFSRTGLVASAAWHLGLIDSPDQFPALLFSGSGAGMVLAFVAKEAPFVMLLTLAVLARTDPRLVQTARMFGASAPRVFFRVVLPRLAPVLHTAFIILYLYTFGAFDIPYLLGESRPGMLAIEIYNLYYERDPVNRPTAMALLVLMLLFSVGFIAVYTRVAARLGAGERKL